ncbi:MAG: tRNA (adenosine(37)-N6)-threonylcarbamoyltransferase complex transferase subunit TsaD [Spirochaetaceae bacterium]|nr:tRNA (adenosine(37)-N6)-threonylcarbamoyltransferase complex transferase subunit TsaD [Spirochaetaceae bacterium]
MKVLGIESSCDECAAAVVEDGRFILSSVVATQIPFHKAWNGVVPEIASRKHTEWIMGVADGALKQAGLGPDGIDGVAVTSRPGLLGSLLVGLTFAKAFAFSRGLPFIACDHMLAHLYAPRLVYAPAPGAEFPPYPFIGLLVSGGHSIICRVEDFDKVTVLGTTIDDAAGEAFDKVAKFYGFGYPGGVCIDDLAQKGDSGAFRFPLPNLHKGSHDYDLSYSGLKTAVINQLEQFRIKKAADDESERANIAASFQKTAVDILLRSLFRAAKDTGLSVIVAGGGVAANSYLRSSLAARKELRCIFPPLELCGDNGAMIAGLGYQYLVRGETSDLSAPASARVSGFKRKYP